MILFTFDSRGNVFWDITSKDFYIRFYPKKKKTEISENSYAHGINENFIRPLKLPELWRGVQ